ncbi:MAG: Peptidase rane alanine aminopeptidase [Blastococcus sp.]|jgi:aminopeptidase N|nr:Peptidase rane alanine aminopeptidase [Blastococcus sp.]
MWRSVTVVAVTAGLLAPTGGTALARAQGGGSPGAAGIGDPYYPLDGNGGYDVQNYDLDLRYDPATDVLSGQAAVRARATQDLSRFDLDLQGLKIASLTVDGRPAAYRRDGGELVVTPRASLHEGATFVVTVAYAGSPRTIHDVFGASGFFHTDDGALVVGEPDVAATWFPANDHPLDPASFDVSITVPSGLEAISNGVLLDQRRHGDWTTWNWQAREPMATYLLGMAIGQFDIRSHSAGGIRFWNALDPDLFRMSADPGDPYGPTVGAVATGSLARQPEIVRWLAGLAGPYPFSAAGGIVDDFAGLEFALENQTRPIYPSSSFSDPLDGDLVIVHELAHQWFGDDLRLAGWQHIWLNEGFATYVEWLWQEREGVRTVRETFDSFYATPARDAFWTVAPGDPGPDELFGDAVYYRGAMTLHALRQAVGDRAFFAILRRWASSQAGDSVTSAEFIALSERISGRQLDALFQRWLFTPSKPARA